MKLSEFDAFEEAGKLCFGDVVINTLDDDLEEDEGWGYDAHDGDEEDAKED